jgi:hypothetical protein
LPNITVNFDSTSSESLGDECFSYCRFFSSLTFKSGLKFLQIHARAFPGSLLLKSIIISRSTKELVKEWALESSLVTVIFESAALLQRMANGDDVDLVRGFAINIDNCDSDIDSVGSSIGRRSRNISHLVH